VPARSVYLIRHADAGSRSEWVTGDRPDDLRPLSRKGDRQAASIASLADGAALARVVSSPSLRCVRTVEPLADRHGVPVETDARLLESTAVDRALELLDEVAGTEVALCTHGDVIPDVLRWLSARGMRHAAPLTWPKGSTWVLEWDGASFASARYVPPPTG
jgi:8-oxo-dGTP diphosphatase